VVERKNKKTKKRKKNEKAVISGEEARKRGTTAPPPRATGAPKPNAAAAVSAKKGSTKTSKVATLPRAPRTSAVTLTLNKGAKTSYADVLAAARRNVPLQEIGVDSVHMRKAMTGAIIIRVPGDKDRGKASLLATRLAEVLDPTVVKVAAPTRTAELRVVGIDISVDKEELWEAFASAIGCGSSQIQVGEISVSRGGLGSAWVKCPVAGARKLAQDEKIKLCWSIGRVMAIPKSSLQSFRCLEIGHVRATCASAVDRAHLCYRCGGSGHRARKCPATAPKCPLCESLGVPANHRMCGAACALPKVKRKKTIRRPAAETQEGGTAKAAEDGRKEAMDLELPGQGRRMRPKVPFPPGPCPR
jgi:hypothetical protein